MRYELKKPVQVGEQGDPVSALVLREEVVAGDLRGIKLTQIADMPAEDMIKIIARLSGQTDLTISKLSILDFAEVAGMVGGFLVAGLETGKTP